MPGLGTIINVAAIFAAGIMGMLFGARIPGRLQESMIICSGIGTIFIAVSGAMEKMLVLSEEGLTSRGSMMLILCLTLGTITGELLQLDERLEKFGEWLKKKTGNAGDNSFVHAFVTASLTVSIGAMAIVGSIQDGISLDPSTLIAKSALDFFIILIMTAALGKGAMFSAVPVGLLQGSMTLLSRLISPVFLGNPAALSNLSLTGSVLIFCVGVNLVWKRGIRVASMLPALVFSVLWAFLPL
ncbi:MAG: DUF554 domain-containing protein [Lachnospiraceae bacterium]|nr:DUF554 domain-containing protein [Lachnospiraceae bacterium]MBQ4304179.1 DUF554 domain-containing protein [Lachnospiraceae bacterium]